MLTFNLSQRAHVQTDYVKPKRYFKGLLGNDYQLFKTTFSFFAASDRGENKPLSDRFWKENETKNKVLFITSATDYRRVST